MSRNVPKVSATNYAGIFTKPIFKNQNGEWFRDVGYEDSLDIIRENFLKARESFVAIGYYLKHLKEKELYKEGGYADIWECAQAEFGLSQTAAFNYMKMNDVYSVNGDTPMLDEKYSGFNKSQLQEMLSLTTEKREEITPEQTVGQIREIVKEEKRSKEPTEDEILAFYEDAVKDIDDEPRSTLKERLKKEYRNAGAVSEAIKWHGSARGIKINQADEITWTQLVKLIDQYIPQEMNGQKDKNPMTERVCEHVSGEDVPAEDKPEDMLENEPQIPGQMQIEDYPEVMPEGMGKSDREEKKLSAYGLPVTEHSEGRLLTTEGCGHKDGCFACAQDCIIRQEDRYCVKAPLGNPFSCTTMNVIGQLKEEMGDSCQFINQERAYHRLGDNSAVPCCKNCTETCEYRCSRTVAKTDKAKSSADSMSGTQDRKGVTPESEPVGIKAEPPDSDGGKKEDIIFISDAHKKFYYEKLKKIGHKDVDVYHKALIYCLGISDETRKNADSIYDFKAGSVRTECLHEGWQTSGSAKVVRMAFNLYSGTPSVFDYDGAEEQVDECRLYTVGKLFCCAYAPYFWQAVRIRYPEYAEEEGDR